VSVGLAMRTHQIIKGRHTKRTAAFVRACVAFCFITIPSMDDIFPRLYLYLLTGQAALVNQCIPQSEALFEAMITLIGEVPEYYEVAGKVISTSEQLEDFVSSLCSELIVVPGHPTEGALFLVRALLQVFEERNWERETITRSLINLKLLPMLCAMVQDRLPYHIDKVESNDVLYKGDPAYQQEVQDIIDSLVDTILENMDELEKSADASARKLRAQLALALFEWTVVLVQLNSKSVTFAADMFKIASGHYGKGDTRIRNYLSYIQSMPDNDDEESSEPSPVAQLQELVN